MRLTFPRSFREAGYNFVNNTKGLLGLGIGLLSLVSLSTTEAHGTCTTGNGVCGCSKDCNEKAACDAIDGMTKEFKDAAASVFNATLSGNSTTSSNQTLFETFTQGINEEADLIRTAHRPELCDDPSAASQLDPSTIITVGLPLLYLGYKGAEMLTESLMPSSIPEEEKNERKKLKSPH